MRWIVTVVLLSGLSLIAFAADWTQPVQPAQAQVAPTTPQVPPPQIDGVRSPVAPLQTIPCPGPQPGCARKNCQDGNCAKSCIQKICAWATYRPTAGDALPLLHFHPYMGPYTGTFVCTTVAGPACAGNGNSCGLRRGGCSSCAAAPNVPGNPGVAATPVVQQPLPPRGCQGGSTQLSDASFPGEAHTTPIKTQASDTVPTSLPEVVEFKAISYSVKAGVPDGQTEFIAAIQIARQVQSPVDLLGRSRP